MNNHLLWDFRFLELSFNVASWSKDPSTKVGSCIVDSKKRIYSLGYNGFPRGVLDKEDRYSERDTKLKFVSHAERNALDNCPFPVENCTLYSTHFPCNECAKSIIQKGIKKVVTIRPSKNKENENHKFTDIMFSESGVLLVQYDYEKFLEWKQKINESIQYF